MGVPWSVGLTKKEIEKFLKPKKQKKEKKNVRQ